VAEAAQEAVAARALKVEAVIVVSAVPVEVVIEAPIEVQTAAEIATVPASMHRPKSISIS